MTTSIKFVLIFAAFAATTLLSLMFYTEPKMIVPSIIGAIIFTLIIILFYKVNSKKSHEEQMRIAKRNGKIASVGIIVLLVGFFIAAAKHYDIPVLDFVRLWFGF